MKEGRIVMERMIIMEKIYKNQIWWDMIDLNIINNSVMYYYLHVIIVNIIHHGLQNMYRY